MLSVLLIQTIALTVTAWILPGLRVTSIVGPILAVACLALANTYFWSAALFFQIPLEVSGHSALLLVCNGLLFWILVKVLPGIEISGIIAPLLAPVLFTILSVVTSTFSPEIQEFAQEVGQYVAQVRDYFIQSELQSSDAR